MTNLALFFNSLHELNSIDNDILYYMLGPTFEPEHLIYSPYKDGFLVIRLLDQNKHGDLNYFSNI